MDERTTTEALAMHGLGHRRATPEDIAALGLPASSTGRVVYVVATGEPLWSGPAYEAHGAIHMLEGSPCTYEDIRCRHCTCAQLAEKARAALGGDHG